ncbi:hypothetical protein LCGC14_2036690, partial [marine sediment metagenome]
RPTRACHDNHHTKEADLMPIKHCPVCDKHVDTLKPHIVGGTWDVFHLHCATDADHDQTGYYVLKVPRNT